ncbi:hypothetical protein ACFE04_009122 [Oxalis oulophora]
MFFRKWIAVSFGFVLLAISIQAIYDNVGACQSLYYNCGNISNVGYPFWGSSRPEYCGNLGFELMCEENQYSVIKILGSEFRVLEINQTDYTMRIARMDLWKSPCLHNGYGNTTMDDRFFNFVDRANQNLTFFYNCSGFSQNLTSNTFNCSANGQISQNYYLNDSVLEYYLDWFDDCYTNSIRVPILKISTNLLIGSLSPQGALNKGFDVEFSKIGKACHDCEHIGYICIYDGMFRCVPSGGFGMKLLFRAIFFFDIISNFSS